MRNYDEMITVREYAQDLKTNGYDNGTMMSAQDYANTLQEQCVKYQSKSLMTVEDYLNTLEKAGDRYMTPVELDIEQKVEKSMKDKKAELNAKIVEDLLA